jgi:hypothetical protein
MDTARKLSRHDHRDATMILVAYHGTTRSSLKNIFRKTKTCRQPELLIVILTALPDSLEAIRVLERPRPKMKGQSTSNQ